jgi:hypothetical protein
MISHFTPSSYFPGTAIFPILEISFFKTIYSREVSWGVMARFTMMGTIGCSVDVAYPS